MTASAVELPRQELPVGHACLTGWAIHVPDGGEGHVPAADYARELLGRKGLLYKEPATLMALCAVHRALGLPPRTPRSLAEPDPRTAVVVSSNLGNAETVTKVARTARVASVRDISLLDAPNASSNVIASTIAIWFRFGGPNLMVCSGATSGLDAVWLASLLLRTGRADRVVVVGVEPDDEISVALRRRRGGRHAPARAGAASLILEPAVVGAGTMPALGPIAFVSDREQLTFADHETLLVGCAELAGPRQSTVDVEEELGDLYGALGVVQVATATALIADTDSAAADTATVVCGDDLDGWRSATICQPRPSGVDP
ncbi:MAG TPA: beta-ketoacyl synthase N-terminal-like domain-containing protein [Solirubrobacteraceae bacterium]|jgi:3-oxoacyl-[acyl-carrier-protein] synthase II|nr:beta-ketoacyl synthase N-terminal-like domain-containing protein [Solirubrobacteraceae bacterium]